MTFSALSHFLVTLERPYEGPSEVTFKSLSGHFDCFGRFCQGKTPVGRTPKGSYSTRGRSRHLLENRPLRTPSENPFSEPFFTVVKLIADPLLRTLLRTPFPEPCPEPSQNPSQNAVLPYAPLGVHPTLG